MSTKVKRLSLHVVHTDAVDFVAEAAPEVGVDTPEETAKRAADFVYKQIMEIPSDRLCSLVMAERDREVE